MGSTGESINGTTLLQFNATIIVGVFLFLTLSSGLFGQVQEPTSQLRHPGALFDWDTLVHNTMTVPSALFIQLGLTIGTIIPFAASSYVIISNGEGMSLDKAKEITKIGLLILLIVLGVLLLNARLAQYS